MAFIPNPDFVASVPLQYVFLDKDTGESLAAGIVTFYSSPDYPVLKDVYQISNNPTTGEVEFTALPNPMILSGIGTFVDNSGNNVVPFYFPYDGTPGASDPGEVELYYVTVQSSGNVLQFTLDDWPPNSLSGGSSSGSGVQSGNIITNPQFSIVSFTEAPATSNYTYSVSGTDTRTALAPGWELLTTGTGTVIVSQESLALDVTTEPPFSLAIQSAGSVTALAVVQRLTESPRILGNPDDTAAISGYLLAKSSGGSATISMEYAPGGVTATQIFSESTDSSGNFTVLTGSTLIDTPMNSQDGSGYVDIIIRLPVLVDIQITSAQVVSVENATDSPGFIQQTTQEQLNNLMWYYEPQLAYKPIPSYTIGWDFPFNPGQQYGTGSTVTFVAGANSARYIADQTIAFQSTTNSLYFRLQPNSVTDPGGLTVFNNATSSWALIQYLDTPTAFELLQNRIAVMLKGYVLGTPTTLVGNVRLYWTTNASVPVLPLTFFATLAGTGADIIPTTLTAGWLEVPRSGLGAAAFQLPVTTAETFNFNMWDATAVANIDNATYFAIVVSFNEMPATQSATLEYVTLCSGDIATPPPAMNEAQTLQALEYYYETSYNSGILPAAVTNDGVIIATQTAANNGGSTSLYAKTFGFSFNGIKRTTPTITFYSEAGTSGNFSGFAAADYANVAGPTNVAIANYTSPNLSQKSVSLSAANANPTVTRATAITATADAWLSFHYVLDARFGVV
jgi:hypothetical protein